MWLEVCLGLLLGSLCGIVPGLHPNTLALFFGDPFLRVAASGAHLPLELFVSFSLLGGEASMRACLLGLLFSSLLFLPLLPALPLLGEAESLVGGRGALLLLFLVIADLAGERPLSSTLLFLSSGLLGWRVLSLSFSSSHKLFALLSGLFAVPSLLIEEDGPPPRQGSLEMAALFSGTLKGMAAGALVGVLPALSPSLAAFGAWAGSDREGAERAAGRGALLSSSLLFSLATLSELGKARNGALVGVDLPLQTMVGVALVSLSAASLLSLLLSGSSLLSPFKRSRRAFILIPLFLSWLWMGAEGVFILLSASSLGLLPQLLGLKKRHLMGCLLLPTFLHFGGYLW